MISDDYLSVEMTVEQAAAMRAILKLEHIHASGAVLNSQTGFTDLQRLEAAILLSDSWGRLDRPFAIALANAILGDKPVTLKSTLVIRMGKVDKTQIAEVLHTGHYRKVLDEAKREAAGYVDSFISVVLIDRHSQALKDIFLPAPQDDKPFTFEQVAPPKGVLN